MKLSLDQCLDNIYYYGSKIFLSSYTSTINGYRSIFDYYAHILLLDTMDSSLFWQLPRLDQLRYLIWTLMTIYYITLCTDIKYYYSDTFRFITNDPTIIIGNGEKIKQIALLLTTYYFSAIYLFTYDSFRTHSSLSMRTFIIYLHEFTDDNNLNCKLLKIIQQKYRHYSHTTCLLLQYAQKNVQTKILEFKKFFSHIHYGVCISNVLMDICLQSIKLNKFIKTRTIWQILLRSISIHCFMIVVNFMISSMYTLSLVEIFTIRIVTKIIRKIKWKSIKLSKNSLQLQLMKTKLNNQYRTYTRLIIFIEQIQPYAAKMNIWGIVVNIVGSQIVINCIKHIENDEYFLLIILYYVLLIELMIIIFTFICNVKIKFISQFYTYGFTTYLLYGNENNRCLF
ncbi:hypothetical protein DERF_012064 [Dermatophagoides farinae]|uniref:Uncharacterized protein n=1 Tax=Dermatophagoides farinae TaxID=6954 RepID=A0A922HP66_DERFA|nr:hypothetical protein DERF_012064 [Dermatophagoides farinae]